MGLMQVGKVWLPLIANRQSRFALVLHVTSASLVGGSACPPPTTCMDLTARELHVSPTVALSSQALAVVLHAPCDLTP